MMKYIPIFLFFLLFPGNCFGQNPVIAEENQESEAEVEKENLVFGDLDELEIFVDGLMAAHFETYHLAGSVISIVKEGEVFFSKGYGFSDVESRRPVDPAVTMFRIGSITKLFTWTAVMQLVEKGVLNPEADVNNYLHAFKVPPDFLEPIKMTHLMTHTAGFEDRSLRLFTRTEDGLLPLEDIFARDLPTRVRPPGTFSAYSNHGSALAGYIVQNLANQPWEEYVTENILLPLEMDSSTVAQPVPSRLSGNMSGGYSWKNGELEKQAFELIPMSPAGSGSATALDMANLMIAFLQSGRFGDNRILEEKTANRMLSVLFTPDPRIIGLGYGFIFAEFNGQKAVGHGGDTIYFHSILLLLPEHNAGLFLSYNSQDGSRARQDFLNAFFKRYFPAEPLNKTPVIEGYQERLSEVQGTYRSNRRPFTTIDRIAELMDLFDVTPGAAAGSIQTVSGSETQNWHEIEPFVFQERDNLEKLVFKPDSNSGRTMVYFGNLPIIAYERLKWYETPIFHIMLVLVSCLVLLTTLILPIATILINQKEDSVLARKLPTHKKSRALAASIGILLLSFLGGLLFILRDPIELAYKVPPILNWLLVLPILAGFLTTVLLVVTATAWRNGYWGLTGRIHYTLVFLSAVAVLWQLNYWNFLGWNF